MRRSKVSISRPCFNALPLLPIPRASQRRLVPIRNKPRPGDTVPCFAVPKASIVILGGSSGVGKEAATYLSSTSLPVKIASRRTGYDFRNPSDALKALAGENRAAISVGAGRGGSSGQDELDVYTSVVSALSSTPDLELAVVVLRSLILPDVKSLFQKSVKVPWVFLRPGPLVDIEHKSGTGGPRKERVLVTTDIRCNGRVSRAAVGRVVGDLLLGKVPIHQIEGRVFGVYDLDRMINHPQGIEVLGKDIWQ